MRAWKYVRSKLWARSFWLVVRRERVWRAERREGVKVVGWRAGGRMDSVVVVVVVESDISQFAAIWSICVCSGLSSANRSDEIDDCVGLGTVIVGVSGDLGGGSMLVIGAA